MYTHIFMYVYKFKKNPKENNVIRIPTKISKMHFILFETIYQTVSFFNINCHFSFHNLNTLKETIKTK